MSIDSIKPAAESAQRSSGGANVTEYIVPPAMLVVAVAAGLACYLHVGYERTNGTLQPGAEQ